MTFEAVVLFVGAVTIYVGLALGVLFVLRLLWWGIGCVFLPDAAIERLQRKVAEQQAKERLKTAPK